MPWLHVTQDWPAPSVNLPIHTFLNGPHLLISIVCPKDSYRQAVGIRIWDSRP